MNNCKKISLSMSIIIAGVIAALAMLLKAFVPGLYSFVSTKVLILLVVAAAAVFAPAKRPDWKCAATFLAVFAVLTVILFLFERFMPLGWLRILLFASLAALGMTVLKQPDFAFTSSLVAGLAAAYAGGEAQKFLLIGVAYTVAYACLNASKTSGLLKRAVYALIICLAFFAFR